MVITAAMKNKEAAKEFFRNENQVTKKCGLTSLMIDRNTDIRKEDQWVFTVIAIHPKGKNSVIKCYDSDEY
tara:strand:+ start:289 stop:501 length:213 start_codon:yes stop_codon:yes gene_type:complete